MAADIYLDMIQACHVCHITNPLFPPYCLKLIQLGHIAGISKLFNCIFVQKIMLNNLCIGNLIKCAVLATYYTKPIPLKAVVSTVKPVLSGHSKRLKIDFEDLFSLNAGQKYCSRMLHGKVLHNAPWGAFCNTFDLH